MDALRFRAAPHAAGSRPRPSLRVVALALALGAAAPGGASAGMHPHDRDGWMLGVGLGGGSLGLTSGGQSSDREFGPTGTLRAHYLIGPRVSIGADSHLWFKRVQGVDWTFSTFSAAAALYPAEGLLLRGGVGFANAKAAVVSGNQTVTSSESGFGLSAGAGYELRLGRPFALTPQVDFSYLNMDGFDANFFSIGVAAHWYLLPS